MIYGNCKLNLYRCLMLCNFLCLKVCECSETNYINVIILQGFGYYQQECFQVACVLPVSSICDNQERVMVHLV